MRFKTIDGLRGVAALAVVFYHLNSAARMTFDVWLPEWLDWLFKQGFLGVDIFFVLSGFVIAFSVRDANPSLRYLGLFAIRRSIRLDPPYWAAIILEIVVQSVALRLSYSDVPLPSIQDVIAHVFYLQNLLGYGDIVSIFWTLCFEIQFYLFLVILMVLRKHASRLLGPVVIEWVSGVVLAALFGLSIAMRYEVGGLTAPQGLAIIRWFQFFIGVCLWWVVSGRVHPSALLATWLVLVGVIGYEGAPPQQTLPIFVSGLIWWSYRRDGMATILSGRGIQWLGAISYSLYLFHTTIGWRFVRLSGRVVGEDAPLWLSSSIFGAGIAICAVAAWLAWWVLERPSMAFSRRIALPKRQGVAEGRD